jgi:type IV pilus biogenesis protein CpaD/CtpE
MKCILVAITVTLLVGCASQKPMPPDVALIPNDCANRVQIINWLELQLKQENHDSIRSQIKHRIWNMRYHCQSV